MQDTAAILTYVRDHIVDHDRPPTMGALARRLGCSPSTAHTIVHGLIDKGYLAYVEPHHTLTLTEPALALIDQRHIV